LAVLTFTKSLLDTDVTADRRMMLPVELVTMCIVGSAVVTAPALVRLVGSAAVVGLIALRLVSPIGPFPEGVAAPRVMPRNSLFDAVAALPRSTIIVTNDPEGVWRDTGRPSIFAPASTNALTGREVSDLPGRLEEMGRIVGERRGRLVLINPQIFGVPIRIPRILSPAEVETYLPCALIVDMPADGFIYDLAPCATPH
jgi:hypothetical protein